MEEQVEKYSKRDLFSSFRNRVLRKRALGPQRLIRRYHVTGFKDSSVIADRKTPESSCTASDIYLSLSSLPTARVKNQKDNSPTLFLDEESNLSVQEFIRKRQVLRTELNKFDFNLSWLRRKPQKTDLEERVLAKMQASASGELIPSYHKDECKRWRTDFFLRNL